MSEVEADGAGYLSEPTPSGELDEFMPPSSPITGVLSEPQTPSIPAPTRRPSNPDPDTFAEAVFFAYGVIVFFGLDEAQERSILEDIETAEIMQKPLPEERWEIEECHYEASTSVVFKGFL